MVHFQQLFAVSLKYAFYDNTKFFFEYVYSTERRELKSLLIKIISLVNKTI